MTATAFLLPGQGSDLALVSPVELDRSAELRRLLAVAGELVGLDLVRGLRGGHPRLKASDVAQPTLVAVSLALAHDRAQAGPAPDAVAGHSLGELAAVSLAGCLSAEQAIEAAVARGRLMAEAARARPGGMVAIRCASEATLPLIVEQGRRHGALAVAARNSPEQWVLSGDRAALGAVAAFAPATILPVAGPWHSPAMAQAATLWEPMLRRLPWQPPRRRLVLAGRAAWAGPDSDVPAALLGQLTQPVRWLDSIELLAGSGISRFVAVGPGRALAGLCRDILGTRAEVIAG